MGTRRWEQNGDWGDGDGDGDGDDDGEDTALTAKYGIGAKLLKGMGWRSGQGLGKEGTGIAEPIQVKVRPKNLGLAYNFQEKTQQQKREEKRTGAASGVADISDAAEDDEGEEEELDDIEGWMRDQDRRRAQPPGRGRGPRRARRTVVVAEKTRGAGTAASPVVVVDATGPARREGPLAPLEHNAVLLAHMAEEQARAARRGTAQAQQRVADAAAECARLEDRLAAERAHVRDAEAFLAALGGGSGSDGDDALSCAQLQRVKAQFPAQWRRFDGSATALAVAEAQLGALTADWDALRQPAQPCGAFAEWRALFGVEVVRPVVSTTSSDSSSDSEGEDEEARNERGRGTVVVVDSPWYERLLRDVLVPCVRRAVLRWDPREDGAGRMVALVETLGRAVLTAAARRRVVAELVYPRVLERVRRWRPQTDATPVDRWVLPWFAHLAPEQREAVWALVGQRIAAVLRAAWTTPRDTSAHTILQPWRAAVPARSLNSLLMLHVTPVLKRALAQLVVRPADDSSSSSSGGGDDDEAREMLRAVVLWEDVLPQATLVSLLTVEFFPRWLQCVRAWLEGACRGSSGGSDRRVFARVGQWYRAWKAVLPPWTTRLAAVQEPLALALEMLDRAMAGEDVASAAVAIAAPSTPAPVSAPQPTRGATREQQQEQPEQEEERVDLREVLEQVATAHDVEFVPTARTHDGMPVYRFGRTSVVLDTRVVRAHDPATGAWPAVSLAALLALQQRPRAPPSALD